MNYGLPYVGSKSKIAEWVVANLPQADVLVDLFAGGCAVTHCALLSGRYKKIIANDLTDAPQVFRDACLGEYKYMSTVLTRDEFFSTNDTALKLLYSFGNNAQDYIWGDDVAGVKSAAERMLSLPSTHERRMAYRDFVKALSGYLAGGDVKEKLVGTDGTHGLQGLQGLEGLERLERLQGLGGLERLERLQGLEANMQLTVLRGDYRLVDVPDGSTVYADPPYKHDDTKYSDSAFDYGQFEQWLAVVPFPVYISEYEAPAGCVEIARRTTKSSMAATCNVTRIERLFVQERFAEQAHAAMLEERLF